MNSGIELQCREKLSAVFRDELQRRKLSALMRIADGGRARKEENVAISREKNGEFFTPDDMHKMMYTANVIQADMPKG
ncbi:hypothetical protein PR202_ga11732 [Eleusine coracana subsp. coracana]|uniref:Uncharacterized protein n=1 Tax=Eleusine coracana subsp. coracana TaxID=191504 RepID=A0AAV5CAD2_ELECO|nr:hypothetical protein PR202_ga11732 [Eleusine coracana subsp. coracana]